MRDRTNELKSPNSDKSGWQSVSRYNQQIDMEMGTVTQTHEQWMSDFFRQISAIQQSIAELEANLPIVERLHSKILSCFQANEEKIYHNKLDQLTSECSELSLNISSKLKAMEKSCETNLKQGTADYRMCFAQQIGLSRKFRSAIVGYQEMQRSYKERQKNRFERQYRIINPDATDKEITRILDTEYQGPIFAQSILNSTQLDEAKRVLSDVKERQREIVVLSRSIMELQRLFDDLSTLICQQDEVVNQVSVQVGSAQTYVANANNALTRAIKSARSARRRKWCLTIVCFVLIAVIVIVILLSIPGLRKAIVMIIVKEDGFDVLRILQPSEDGLTLTFRSVVYPPHKNIKLKGYLLVSDNVLLALYDSNDLVFHLVSTNPAVAIYSVKNVHHFTKFLYVDTRNVYPIPLSLFANSNNPLSEFSVIPARQRHCQHSFLIETIRQVYDTYFLFEDGSILTFDVEAGKFLNFYDSKSTRSAHFGTITSIMHVLNSGSELLVQTDTFQLVRLSSNCRKHPKHVSMEEFLAFDLQFKPESSTLYNNDTLVLLTDNIVTLFDVREMRKVSSLELFEPCSQISTLGNLFFARSRPETTLARASKYGPLMTVYNPPQWDKRTVIRLNIFDDMFQLVRHHEHSHEYDSDVPIWKHFASTVPDFESLPSELKGLFRRDRFSIPNATAKLRLQAATDKDDLKTWKNAYAFEPVKVYTQLALNNCSWTDFVRLNPEVELGRLIRMFNELRFMTDVDPVELDEADEELLQWVDGLASHLTAALEMEEQIIEEEALPALEERRPSEQRRKSTTAEAKVAEMRGVSTAKLPKPKKKMYSDLRKRMMVTGIIPNSFSYGHARREGPEADYTDRVHFVSEYDRRKLMVQFDIFKIDPDVTIDSFKKADTRFAEVTQAITSRPGEYVSTAYQHPVIEKLVCLEWFPIIEKRNDEISANDIMAILLRENLSARFPRPKTPPAADTPQIIVSESSLAESVSSNLENIESLESVFASPSVELDCSNPQAAEKSMTQHSQAERSHPQTAEKSMTQDIQTETRPRRQPTPLSPLLKTVYTAISIDDEAQTQETALDKEVSISARPTAPLAEEAPELRQATTAVVKESPRQTQTPTTELNNAPKPTRSTTTDIKRTPNSSRKKLNTAKAKPASATMAKPGTAKQAQLDAAITLFAEMETNLFSWRPELEKECNENGINLSQEMHKRRMSISDQPMPLKPKEAKKPKKMAAVQEKKKPTVAVKADREARPKKSKNAAPPVVRKQKSPVAKKVISPSEAEAFRLKRQQQQLAQTQPKFKARPSPKPISAPVEISKARMTSTEVLTRERQRTGRKFTFQGGKIFPIAS